VESIVHYKEVKLSIHHSLVASQEILGKLVKTLMCWCAYSL